MERFVNGELYAAPSGMIKSNGEIYRWENGVQIFGCPHCGALYVDDCFCGFITKFEPRSFFD
jgi:hypothetical protein